MTIFILKEIPEVAECKENWNEWRARTGYTPLLLDSLCFDNRDLSDFHFMHCTIVRCSFVQATLHETNFRSAVLTECDLRDAKFWKTMLEDVDVSSCRFNDFPVNCFVQGAKISTRQLALIQANMRKLTCLG